ncbi:MAG: hypothetical protein ACI8ZB_003769 [Desulforhopalus sp.]|jgi:hypothetical protein
MNKTYKANPKYRLSILFYFLLFSIPTLFAIIDWVRYDNKAELIIILILFVIILIFYVFFLVREITISDKYVQVKTLFFKRTIPIQKIISVAKSFSTSSMIWYSQDKSRAHMLCTVRFGTVPFGFFVLHNGLSNFKEACEQLESIKGSNI